MDKYKMQLQGHITKLTKLFESSIDEFLSRNVVRVHCIEPDNALQTIWQGYCLITAKSRKYEHIKALDIV